MISSFEAGRARVPQNRWSPVIWEMREMDADESVKGQITSMNVYKCFKSVVR